MYLHQALKASSIQVMTSTKIKKLSSKYIEVETSGQEISIPFTDYTIVEATGYMNRSINFDVNTEKKVYLIGDAKNIGNVYTAVRDAYELVAELCNC